MNEKRIPVVAVVGPTASGKTVLAVQIATWYQGEVVSADSMQIYRGMDIATAKPTAAEMRGISHHLIDVLDPGQSFSVAEYLPLAHAAIADIHARGKLPILTGGTGLYVDSLLHDVALSEIEGSPEIRRELEEYAERNGAAALHSILRECDPELAETLHENNRGRIIRAIEVFRVTGIPMSEHQRRSRLEPTRYRSIRLGINYRDRNRLYARIDRRVDQMAEAGLLQEAEEFLRRTDIPTAAQAIGYKELAGYFRGEKTLEAALDGLKQSTRRYAKRQLTWFRRDEETHWLYPDEQSAEEIEKNIRFFLDKFLGL
jgi:tRNA dimethylallyltransferase